MIESTVRVARAGDEEFVLALSPRFAETRAPWRTAAEVEAGTRRWLERVLQRPRDDEVLLVAEDGAGSRAGFLYAYTEPDFFTREPHAHISEIAVVEDGGGAGRALMLAAEAWARERGHTYVSLHVNARNERGLRFYERLGYDLEWRRMNKRLR